MKVPKKHQEIDTIFTKMGVKDHAKIEGLQRKLSHQAFGKNMAKEDESE